MRKTATVTIAETAITVMNNHRWNRGERIPPEYRDRQFVIDDWREHRLAPPPRGYHWVGVGGDYYLVRPDGFVFNVTIGG